MRRITDKDMAGDIRKMAIKRYTQISRNDYGEETFDHNALLMYHLTTDGLNYHVVEIDKDDADSDDIAALLEWSLHDIADRTAEQFLDDVLFQIMGAITRDELDDIAKEYDEYIDLDRGYVLPGLIDTVSIVEVEDKIDQEHEYTSATAGDYSPSSPWNAPGMSVHDFI